MAKKTIVGQVAGTVSDAVASAIDAIAHPMTTASRARKAMGKSVVFHFHGCEVRKRAHMLGTHRLSTCTDCDPFCRPRRQDKP